MSSSSASEWKAQAKWQVDTPKLEIRINNLQNYIQNNNLFQVERKDESLKSLRILCYLASEYKNAGNKPGMCGTYNPTYLEGCHLSPTRPNTW
jgi:hypothetical protein